jgi:hypothetical protein
MRPSALILPGDLAWFATGPTTGHCGIVIGTGPGEAAVVEGNHLNRVELVRRSMSEMRFGCPLPVEEPPAIPPMIPLIPVKREGTR